MDEQSVPTTQPEETILAPQTPNKIVKKAPFPYAVGLSVVVILIIIGSIVFRGGKKSATSTAPTEAPSLSSFFVADTIKPIASNAQFEALFGKTTGNASHVSLMKTADLAVPSAAGASQSTTVNTPERVSSTNVQVLGIDEPDIVKTDGSTIFYSKESVYRYAYEDVMMKRVSSGVASLPTQSQAETVLVGALPPSEMKMRSSLPVAGDMLVSQHNLVIFGQSEKGGPLLTGYNVINPGAPKKLWELPFSSRSQKVAARLYKDKIYLVLSTAPSMPRPCPLSLSEGSNKIQVPCTGVFIPSSVTSSDVVYTTLVINPTTGAIEKNMSIAGQSANAIVYMSSNSLYLNYFVEADSVAVFTQFIAENRGVFPSYIEAKIQKLSTYDLSVGTKEIELSNIFSQYLNSLDDDTRLKEENNLKNAISRFLDKNQRSFAYTGIVKFNLDSLSITANGKVPGQLLNQYALDEWKGQLRVATTVGSRGQMNMVGLNSGSNSVSDVYVLDDSLGIRGSIKDLGKTERIYSVRFVEDRGYVVTYKETDPLFVLDLSNAVSPVLKGQLEIPGYSSYLHPLDSHLLLGIGRDQSQVKLSLFNVSDPTSPKEVSHYELANEYWSDALDDPHTFLQDAKYNIFFLPGSRGGYVFSYDANGISLVKALESSQVKRALYMNDYLYIVSNDGISSFKEGTWEKASDFTYEKITPTPTSIPTSEPSVTGVVPTVVPASGSASKNQ